MIEFIRGPLAISQPGCCFTVRDHSSSCFSIYILLFFTVYCFTIDCFSIYRERGRHDDQVYDDWVYPRSSLSQPWPCFASRSKLKPFPLSAPIQKHVFSCLHNMICISFSFCMCICIGLLSHPQIHVLFFFCIGFCIGYPAFYFCINFDIFVWLISPLHIFSL